MAANGPHQVTYDGVATPKLWIAILTALDTIWFRVVLAAIPNWTSSGHLRRCSDAGTTKKSLSRDKYPSIHYPLDTIWFRVVLAAIPNWTSSGHLRRCSGAGTTKKSLSRDKYPSILS
eukprot:scaffold11054_cov198-Skeletonema_marinoi.AAC.1